MWVAVGVISIALAACGGSAGRAAAHQTAPKGHGSYSTCIDDPTVSLDDCNAEFPDHGSRLRHAVAAQEQEERRQRAAVKLSQYVADYGIPSYHVQAVRVIVGNYLSQGHSATEAYRFVLDSGPGGGIRLDGQTLGRLVDLVLAADYPEAGPSNIHVCTPRDDC